MNRSLAILVADELARLAPRYASVLAQHPELSAHPTVPALVCRLTDPKKNKTEAQKRERSLLVAAIVGAYQPAHDRLWVAILVAAFRPMLKRFYGADPEEREAIFFAALFKVVDRLDVHEAPEDVHAIVWRKAKKIMVQELRRQTAWAEVGFGDDAEVTADATSWLPEPFLAAWLLCRRGSCEDRPDVHLVVRVQECGSLRAYVEAEYPDLLPVERSRVYERLRQRYRRTVDELRELLLGPTKPAAAGGSVPSSESATALCLPLDIEPANDTFAVASGVVGVARPYVLRRAAQEK